MNGLIQKSGYIKPGSGGGHYAEYIATRDGVEMIEPAASGYLEYMAERPRSHGLFAMELQIWSKQWKRSMHTLVRCGPSSIP